MTRKTVAASAAALIGGGMICAAALCAAVPAAAHHSFAMYDNDHQLKVSGTVASFQWTNPHVYIELETEAGAPTKHYTIECASPGILTRVGWKFNMIKAGDKLTIVISPLKNGDARFPYKPSTGVPNGTIVNGGGVEVYDPDGNLLAVTGSQQKPMEPRVAPNGEIRGQVLPTKIKYTKVTPPASPSGAFVN